jgi:hypothetical protein
VSVGTPATGGAARRKPLAGSPPETDTARLFQSRLTGMGPIQSLVVPMIGDELAMGGSTSSSLPT